jgi:TPR repeat protein
VAGANILYTPDGRIVCPACFAKAPPPADFGRAPWRTFAIAGGVVGAIPFAVNMSTSSSTMVNGEVTSFVYRDWIAVAAGVVAIMLGAIAVGAARKEQLQRALAFAAGIGVMLLGGVQIARGFGVFADPGGNNGGNQTSISIERTVSDEPREPEKPKGDPKSPETCPDPETCFNLGLAIEKTDPAASTKAFERSCELGATGGCFNAGFDYTNKQPPDNDKALKFFQIACDNGHPGACNEIGRIAATGAGGQKVDWTVAKEMFEKSCNADNAQACANLGIIYDQGHGVKKDAVKARELYEKGCSGGNSNGCFNVAVMREKGQGGPKDKAGAKAAYKESCDQGDDDACKRFEKMK